MSNSNIETWKNNARKHIEKNDWNKLYNLALMWIKDQQDSGIPIALAFVSSHFRTPYTIEDIIDLKMDNINVDEILEWLEKLQESESRNILYSTILSFKDVEASNKALKKEANKNPTPEVYITLGISYSDTGKDKEYFDKAIKLDKNNSFALFKRAHIDIKNENYESALAFLKKAVHACEEFSMARYDLADIYARESKEEERINHLNKIVEIEQDKYFGKMAKEQLEGKRIPRFGKESEFLEMLSYYLRIGGTWGSSLVIIKIIYGFTKGYGVIESIFSINTFLAFAMGFILGIVFAISGGKRK